MSSGWGEWNTKTTQTLRPTSCSVVLCVPTSISDSRQQLLCGLVCLVDLRSAAFHFSFFASSFLATWSHNLQVPYLPLRKPEVLSLYFLLKGDKSHQWNMEKNNKKRKTVGRLWVELHEGVCGRGRGKLRSYEPLVTPSHQGSVGSVGGPFFKEVQGAVSRNSRCSTDILNKKKASGS